MQKYIVLHSHEYGSTVYLFTIGGDLEFVESHAEKICAALEICFEPERNETIEFFEADDEFKHIKI